ncbi:esterase [Levilactobacillus namurensis DSM 19117]|uniref:Esterase n=1 Tax=Levilactobacillus namurensis DSM 19117 TaxID=1423773 RepID=A0A0R1K0V4_9LACO|nr:alpha/beta hydrolase [Levilactobacillus namurensis]KRK74468.1 esterase [Levilactobacillus namurensis DSM 19117]
MKVSKRTLGAGDYRVTVTYYQPDPIADLHVIQKRPLAIILPGGGFTFYSQRESEIIALNYLAQGFAAVVVDYRLADQPPVLPTALYQLGTVVAYFRARAVADHLSPDHFILAGFSAGGYLAALYADHWSAPFLTQALGVASDQLKVNALALAYPVIGLRLGWPSTAPEREAIAGEWPYHEADQLVTAANPPTFIWATQTDELVPVTNAQHYIQALRAAGVSVQSTIYATGPHGLSLARAFTAFPKSYDAADATFGAAFVQPTVAHWFADELDWLDQVWNLTAFWRNQ